MILNSYAVLLSFVGLLRLLLGLGIVGLAAATWRARAQPVTEEGQIALENRTYLVFLLALWLLGLNLVSWPLLYLLLQSYVSAWAPMVMCIYGVTQIGRDSLGSSRFLPDLLRFLQVTKPALVFVSGAWFVLYLLNRRTLTGPLLGRLFVMLLPLGVLAAADAAAELAYLAIPKKEEIPPGGCCTIAEEEKAAMRFLPTGLASDAAQPWLYLAYYGANLGLILALLSALRSPETAPGAGRLACLLVGDVLVLAISGVFLVEVAAPTLLRTPLHHCAYDLIPKVPESLVAVCLFLAGCFFLGWACVVRWFGRCRETEPVLGKTVRGLLGWSLLGYLASLAMLSLELGLA
jgi:hypothetical protein